jgi:hypothetical protein
MPPGSPLYVGKDVVKYFWPEPEDARPSAAADAAPTQQCESDPEFEAELARLRCDVASLRLEWELAKFASRGRKYDPNQPRVPAGNPDGGQWTSEGGGGGTSDRDVSLDPGGQKPSKDEPGAANRKVVRDQAGQQPWETVVSDYRSDGSLARQMILNRDGSEIRSEFSADSHADGWDERHVVRLADGSITTFRNAGRTQMIFNSDGEPVLSTESLAEDGDAEATVRLIQSRIPISRPTLFGAAAALYGWLSSGNTSEQRAFLGFRADAYRPGARAVDSAIRIGRLTKEEVADFCPKYADVQSFANESARVVNRGDFRSPAEYGTAVHMRIKELVNGPETTPPRAPRDPNFRAEISVIKSNEEGYGVPGTRRIDVLENAGNGTVCVYDVKTGGARLYPGRSLELATNVGQLFPGTRRILVMEVKPEI